MIGSRLIKSNDVAAGCEDIVDAYDPFGDSSGLALYQLNGDALDLSPNDYDAASTSGITWGTAGVFGTSASYNGSTSNIRLPDNLSVATGSNDFTLSAWVYLDTFNPSFTSIITTQANWYFYIMIAPDGQVRTYNQVVSVNSSVGVISTGQWYHIVATLSSTSGKNVYVNGVNVASSLDTSNCVDRSSSNGQNALGYYNSTGTANEYHIDGKIDQVRIFNTGLTPLEVEALYTEELCICGGTVDTLDILDDNSCIALYPLDGNANDLSGNYSGKSTDVSYGVGEFDLAAVFNGSSSNIQIDTLSGFTNYNFTLSAWIKTTDSVGYAIAFRDPIYMTLGPGLYTGGTNGMGIYDGTNQYFINNAAMQTINDGNWKHIVMTHDGTNLKGYINGSIIDTVSTGTTTQFSGGTNFNRIGIRADGNTSAAYNGSIDQVRIFNKALDQEDVTTLFNETACAYGGRQSEGTQILGGTSCIAYYKLDGTADDETGNYDGTFTNPNYDNGEFDFASYFDGSNKITLDYSALKQRTMSISLWVKTTSVGFSTIASNFNAASTEKGFGIFLLSNGTFQLSVSGGAAGQGSNHQISEINNNQWYNIVLSFDFTLGGNNLTGYLDGVNVLSTNYSLWSSGDASTALTIGSLANDLYPFTGSIDQVRIFNKLLSPSEVTTIYNEGI